MPRKPKIESFRPSEASAEIEIDKVKWIARVNAFLENPRTRIVSGILLLTLALLLTVAYVSYFFTGAADQSVLQLPHAERVAQRLTVHNILGLPGAWMGEGLVDNAFGVVSFMLMVMLTLYGLYMLHAMRFGRLRLLLCGCFWLVWGSVLLGFAQQMTGIDAFFRWGGAFGQHTAYWMNSYIQPVGMIIVLTVTLVIFLILADKLFIERVKNLWQWLKQKSARRRQPELTEDVETSTPTAHDDEQSAHIDLSIETTEEHEPNPVTENEFELVIEEQDATDDETADAEEPENDDVAEKTADSAQTEEPDEANLEIEDVQEVEINEDDPEYILKTQGPYDPRAELSQYKFPSLSLLKVYDNESAPVINQEEQQNNANRIVTTLRNYGIEIDSIKATVGPTVTLYEIVPKAGVRVAKIQALENDIMLSLSATGIRIIAPMPGKGTIGIEVPNEKPQVVSMHSVIASKRFQEEQKMRLPIAYGRTITNEVFMFDLAKTPHLLVAGATGTGKSVAINAIITSLLYKKHPAEMKLVMVDPKMVEFAPYKPLLKHYLAAMPDTDPEQVVITDCDKVVNTLNSLVIEMENRYKLLMDAGVRNLEDYNEKFVNRRLNPKKVVADTLHHQYLPYIVIIIDEYGDFIMQAGKQVETPIARITQKARAVGMHMILATQRPSVNIVTGVIKANIPTRIALRTQSVIDSRTVLDAKGAEQLIGRGDSLYAGNASVTRIQCAFVDTPEVDAIVEHIEKQQGYFEPYQLPEYVGEGGEGEAAAPGSVDMKRLDPMFADVARYVVTKQEGSTSRLQRAFEIGYNRAGKLSDQLEAAGIVGPNKGPKGRDVLIQDLSALDQLLEDLGVK